MKNNFIFFFWVEKLNNLDIIRERGGFMKLCLNDLLLAFSNALDYAEIKRERATKFHGKRVAYYTLLMGEYFQFKQDDLDNLLGCAILHDNGLTEFSHLGNSEEISDDEFMRLTCEAGEENIKYLKFYPKVKNVIKYHQEMVDGSGPFSKIIDEVPLFSQIIHIIDWVDIQYDLRTMGKEEYEKMLYDVNQQRQIAFTDQIVDAFVETMTYEKICESQQDIDQILRQHMNHNYFIFSEGDMLSVCYLFANIIDSKSPFTKTHSLGVANKVSRMGVFYHFDNQMIIHTFFAGAMHDIGKMIIERDILEKNDRLTEEEFTHIQTHAYETYKILSEMQLGDIVHWASFHHEKLDGSGYPFGKTADDLDFNDRLIGCCDIYQALREERSYKKAMTHEQAIEIMQDMACQNKIDGRIVADMDQVFKEMS